MTKKKLDVTKTRDLKAYHDTNMQLELGCSLESLTAGSWAPASV